MRKILNFALILLIAGGITVTLTAGRKDGLLNSVPRLLEPHETLAVSGQPAVFVWKGVGMSGDSHLYDDFRVYAGNQAYESEQVFKQQVKPKVGRAEVPADLLNKPGIYCWTVRQIGSRSKTRQAFSVFKIST